MAEKLSWTELRRILASRAGVSEKEANAFLTALNAEIVEALKTDKQVKINGKKAAGVTYDKTTGTLTIPVAIPDVTQTTIIELVK